MSDEIETAKILETLSAKVDELSKALNETDAVHMHFTQKEDSVNDVGKLCLYHRWLAKIRNWHKRVHEG